MEIRLLGQVSATRLGVPVDLGPRRQRFVLAVLALEVNQAVPVSRLIELSWPTPAPRTALNAIQVCVSRIRSSLPELVVDREDDAYRLRADPRIIDVHRFWLLVDEAAGMVPDENRVALLTSALDLWTGSALAGAAPPEVRDRLCRGLESVRLSAIEDRIDALLSLGRHREALAQTGPLIDTHPWRERLVAQHMVALTRDSQAQSALAAFTRVQHRLADEFGIDPGPRLRHLQYSIMRGDLTPVPCRGVES